MKKKDKLIISFLTFLAAPEYISAMSNKNYSISSFINFNAIIQLGAVMNNTNDTNNFNIIIIGMIVIILILVGAAMFAPKK